MWVRVFGVVVMSVLFLCTCACLSALGDICVDTLLFCSCLFTDTHTHTYTFTFHAVLHMWVLGSGVWVAVCVQCTLCTCTSHLIQLFVSRVCVCVCDSSVCLSVMRLPTESECAADARRAAGLHCVFVCCCLSFVCLFAVCLSVRVCLLFVCCLPVCLSVSH